MSVDSEKGTSPYKIASCRKGCSYLQMMLRRIIPVVLCLVPFLIISNAQSTVNVISKRDPTKSWECLVPVANDDTSRPEYGSCMPEALCDKTTQKSKWKNLYG